MRPQDNHDNNLDAAKAALRAPMRAARVCLGPAERRRCSREIVQRLEQLDFLINAKNIGAYLAFPTEVNVDLMIDRATQRGQNIYLPRMRELKNPLRLFTGLEQLESDPRQPAPDAPGIDSGKIEIIVVPGLAFDRHGNRLGQGGGWYDRVLARSSAIKIGVCFAENVIDYVPHTALDVRMDYVVTENEVVDAAGCKP